MTLFFPLANNTCPLDISKNTLISLIRIIWKIKMKIQLENWYYQLNYPHEPNGIFIYCSRN